MHEVTSTGISHLFYYILMQIIANKYARRTASVGLKGSARGFYRRCHSLHRQHIPVEVVCRAVSGSTLRT